MVNELSKLNARTTRQINATDAQIEKFILGLNKFLRNSLEEILGDIVSGKTKGVEAITQISGIFTQLNNAGLGAKVGELRVIYAEELRFIRDEFMQQDFENPFSAVDKAGIETLIQNGAQKVATQVQNYGLDIQSLMTQQIITGAKPDFKQIESDFGPRVESNIRSELNTSISGFNGTIVEAKAKELGINLFLYDGPQDKITRPFCRKLLNKEPPIYTRDEIAAMDNGQGLAVFQFKGGYNCRHQWRAVSNDLAKRLGYAD